MFGTHICQLYTEHVGQGIVFIAIKPSDQQRPATSWGKSLLILIFLPHTSINMVHNLIAHEVHKK